MSTALLLNVSMVHYVKMVTISFHKIRNILIKKSQRIHTHLVKYFFLFSPYLCFVLYLYACYNSFHMRMSSIL